jgi:nitrogen fixation/metabolism regulation signal transduction histidine kinase
MSLALRYLLLSAAALVAVLLYLLTAASANTQLFETYYSWILGANVAAGALLFVLVLFLLARLASRYRRKRFGSRLMTRLVLMFTLMGVLPGVVIYLVSVQFVSRSIESWFNVKVETALESGLTLGRSALEASLADLRQKARGVASELSEMSDAALVVQLPRIAERNRLNEVAIVSGSGHLIASTSNSVASLVPDLPTPSMIARARSMDGFGLIEGDTETGSNRNAASKNSLRIRVVMAIRGDGSLLSLGGGRPRYLQVIQPVPEQLAANAEALRIAYGEYQ